MRNLTVLFIACSTLAVGACKKSADTASPDQSIDTSDAGDDVSRDPNKGKVQLDPKLAELCNIPEPSFDFDSTKLSAGAKSTLDALVACLVEGAAKDHDVRLVGHADPRGDEEYNLGLGQRRATSVVDYLSKGGVPAARMESSSRGELDAVGTDEASWREDRRVDIMIAD